MALNGSAKANEQTPLLINERSVSSNGKSSLSLSTSETIPILGCDVQTVSQGRDLARDEEAGSTEADSSTPKPFSTTVGSIVPVLLIGGFISNADGSLVLATHPVIASEFNALHDSSWLLASYGLAAAATQPLYGKLSDIFGRKAILIWAYILFAIGCALVGVGTSMWQVILGRIISGAGSAGMIVLVSILITDLVPLRDVALWRSYVNVIATTGRSLGGPLGGWLADTIGWRWSFLGQVPFIFLAIILVYFILPAHTEPQSKHSGSSIRSKLARIDFLGASLMTLAILAFLFPIQVGGVKVPWSHPLIYSLLSAAVLLLTFFLATEAWWAKEPIIPLTLLRQRDAAATFVNNCCMTAAQVSVMFAVPLYFQITAHASNTVAGAHLFPAVAGNAIGGIGAGMIIRRTGRYKVLLLFAAAFAGFGYFLLVLRWHGNTNLFESLYIVPGGLGCGVAQSAVFIGLQAAIDPAYTAIASSALYLSGNIGMVIGFAGTSAVMQEGLRRGLDSRLRSLDLPEAKLRKIMERVVSDVEYVHHAKSRIAALVKAAYVEGLMWTHVGSLVISGVAFVAGLVLREYKL